MLTNKIKNFFKGIVNHTPYQLVRKSTIQEYFSHTKALSELIDKRLKASQIDELDTIDCIVFSKDRALQLHALLSTYIAQVKNPAPLHLLYRCSSSRHRKAYDSVFALFGNKIQSLHDERCFKSDLIGILESLNSAKVMFLVDDIIFINPVELHSFVRLPSVKFVPSLRLGKQLSYSYWHQKPMPLPVFIPEVVDDQNKLCWVWEQGEMEWGFPLSLDGHIFSRQEFVIMIKRFEFNGPNSLEGVMKRFQGIYMPRYGVCPVHSVLVNIPCNRVQTEYNYPHGNTHQDFLLEKWEEGFQINVAKFNAMKNRSVHEDVPLEFIHREER